MLKKKESGGMAPLDRALTIVERRWSCKLMFALIDGERSFAELQRELDAITPRMLSRRLREFEQIGIVATRSERRPHHVYYRLQYGVKELREMIAAMRNWGRRVR